VFANNSDKLLFLNETMKKKNPQQEEENMLFSLMWLVLTITFFVDVLCDYSLGCQGTAPSAEK